MDHTPYGSSENKGLKTVARRALLEMHQDPPIHRHLARKSQPLPRRTPASRDSTNSNSLAVLVCYVSHCFYKYLEVGLTFVSNRFRQFQLVVIHEGLVHHHLRIFTRNIRGEKFMSNQDTTTTTRTLTITFLCRDNESVIDPAPGFTC